MISQQKMNKYRIKAHFVFKNVKYEKYKIINQVK